MKGVAPSLDTVGWFARSVQEIDAVRDDLVLAAGAWLGRAIASIFS